MKWGWTQGAWMSGKTEMMKALIADGEKLEALTGQFHGPMFMDTFFGAMDGGKPAPMDTIFWWPDDECQSGHVVVAACRFR